MDWEFYRNEQKFEDNKSRRSQSKEMWAKNQVKRIVDTSIQTTMIGSLVDFEEQFGYLWGMGKDYDNLTDEQKKMREKWLDARDSILARGNNSKKLSLAAVNRCKIVDYPEKRYNVIIKDKGNKDERRY